MTGPLSADRFAHGGAGASANGAQGRRGMRAHPFGDPPPIRRLVSMWRGRPAMRAHAVDDPSPVRRPRLPTRSRVAGRRGAGFGRGHSLTRRRSVGRRPCGGRGGWLPSRSASRVVGAGVPQPCPPSAGRGLRLGAPGAADMGRGGDPGRRPAAACAGFGPGAPPARGVGPRPRNRAASGSCAPARAGRLPCGGRGRPARRGQYSTPICAFTPARKGCLTSSISVTRSAASISSGLALRPVSTTWVMGGFSSRRKRSTSSMSR